MSAYGQHIDAIKKLGEQQFPGNNCSVMPNSGMATELSSIYDVRNGSLSPSSLAFALPQNRQELASLLQARKNGRFDLHNTDDRKTFSAFLKKAANARLDDAESAKAWTELSEYRKFEFQTDILASPWALAAFQIVNLKDDELPLIIYPRSRNLQRFTVMSVSIDGQATRDQWISAKDMLQVEMEMLSTPRVRYRLMDLQTGDVNEYSAIQRELQYDMDMKIDDLAKTNIDAIAMTSGLRDLLSIDSRIPVANIPDANSLDLSGVDTAGELSIGKLKSILAHLSMFQYAGGALEPFTISNIQISPQNISDIWDFVSLVSGIDANYPQLPADTVPDSVREQVFRTGTFTNAWGHTFSLTPNPRLAKGAMYVFTTQPVGWALQKPGMDKVLNWDERVSPTYAEENYGETLMRKAFKIFMPDSWRQRICIVTL